MRQTYAYPSVAVLLLALQAAAPAASVPVDDVVARLTVAEKAGQLVVFSVGGSTLSGAERDVIRRYHLGGVILFSKNYENRSQLSALTSQIQKAARSGNRFSIGALVAADQEGGVVKRFEDMPPWYSPPEMGENGTARLAFEQGRKTGGALSSVGVNVDLAPVADLDLPPEHVMRERSFGSGRYRVARLVGAFGRGLQKKRVVATAKHFPGFGGATVNSDYGRAYVHRTKRQLHDVDAVPFHRSVRDGIRMIMVSHGIYLNDGGSRPASVNRYIATHRLRNEFDFPGVAISDALDAVAWMFDGSIPRACAATIRAGVDVALIVGGVDVARDCVLEIRRAVRSGAISEARLDQAVARVLELKAWLGVFDPPEPPAPSPSPSSTPSASAGALTTGSGWGYRSAAEWRKVASTWDEPTEAAPSSTRRAATRPLPVAPLRPNVAAPDRSRRSCRARDARAPGWPTPTPSLHGRGTPRCRRLIGASCTAWVHERPKVGA